MNSKTDSQIPYDYEEEPIHTKKKTSAWMYYSDKMEYNRYEPRSYLNPLPRGQHERGL